jgi:RNA polymerase sigma-70 factor (ECF subfamily)
LLTAFRQFLINESERLGALKRGGGVENVSIDTPTGQRLADAAMVEDESPESAFERAWARTVLSRVIAALEVDWKEHGKADWFAALEPFLSGGRDAGESYADAGARLGVSADRVRLAAFRLRRQYREQLLREIAETIESDEPAVIEDELNYLMRAVS